MFSFLTCGANGVVGPIHAKAMPVLLSTPEEWSPWLAAPTEIAPELQRPLPDAQMRIVARGARRDPSSLPSEVRLAAVAPFKGGKE